MTAGRLTCVVPLAGPDFVLSGGRVKALQDMDGEPLLIRTLQSRAWASSESGIVLDYTFVLLDREETRRFVAQHLRSWFPGCRVCFLGGVTQGAALSALCGVAGTNLAAPLCIDLADIVYETDFDPVGVFGQSESLGGVGLTFTSHDPIYSYLELNEAGLMVRAREKQVISSHASAGTYFFRSAEIYLDAVSHSLRHSAQLAHKGLLFVCPLLNGVVAAGLQVQAYPVQNVVDAKILQ